jgi:hypothetical protein
VLDEAEQQFEGSAVLARERQSHAEALGLQELARRAARSQAELPPRTAWEHYALGRSLLAAGELLCFSPTSVRYRAPGLRGVRGARAPDGRMFLQPRADPFRPRSRGVGPTRPRHSPPAGSRGAV